MAAKAIQFTVDNWEAIEKMAGQKIDKDKGWYTLLPTPEAKAPIKFLYGDWIINRDGVIYADENKPKGI